jgi:hypothetical protein
MLLGAAEEELDGWQGDEHHLALAQCAFVYAGNVDVEAYATLAAGAANPESDVDAMHMAGELTSKRLHGADSCGCCVLTCMACAFSSWLC